VACLARVSGSQHLRNSNFASNPQLYVGWGVGCCTGISHEPCISCRKISCAIVLRARILRQRPSQSKDIRITYGTLFLDRTWPCGASTWVCADNARQCPRTRGADRWLRDAIVQLPLLTPHRGCRSPRWRIRWYRRPGCSTSWCGGSVSRRRGNSDCRDARFQR